MGKNNRKPMHTQREEQQGKKVMMGIGVVAVILAVLMIVLFAYMG